VVVLINTDDGSAPPAGTAAEIARAALGLKKRALLDLPLPSAELAALSGKYDSDDGIAEIFARDGKLHFRIPGTQTEGVLLRQAENVYAIDENIQVHFVKSSQREWAMVYNGGLFLDARNRVTDSPPANKSLKVSAPKTVTSDELAQRLRKLRRSWTN
jgi:hypothetical protein